MIYRNITPSVNMEYELGPRLHKCNAGAERQVWSSIALSDTDIGISMATKNCEGIWQHLVAVL